MRDRPDDGKEIPLNEIDVHDLGAKFSGHLTSESAFLGHIAIPRLKDLLEALGFRQKLQTLGFQPVLEIETKSDQDQRIYYKTADDDILFFLRVKLGNYQLSKNSSPRQLVAVDWFQTQNIYGRKKDLFPGQSYPGLGIGIIAVFKQLVLKLVELTDSDGIITVPEYFHDAVMFVKLLNLRFVNPQKAADYEHLLELGPVKEISRAVEARTVSDMREKEPYHWQHGEMVKFLNSGFESAVFDDSYYKELAHLKKTNPLSIHKDEQA